MQLNSSSEKKTSSVVGGIISFILTTIMFGFCVYVLDTNRDAANDCGHLYEFIIFYTAASFAIMMESILFCCGMCGLTCSEQSESCGLCGICLILVSKALDFLTMFASVGCLLWTFILYFQDMKVGFECSDYYHDQFHSLWLLYMVIFWIYVGMLSLIALVIVVYVSLILLMICCDCKK